MWWSRTMWHEPDVNKVGTTRLVHVSHALPSRRLMLGATQASTAQHQRDVSILTTLHWRRQGYARVPSGFWRLNKGFGGMTRRRQDSAQARSRSRVFCWEFDGSKFLHAENLFFGTAKDFDARQDTSSGRISSRIAYAWLFFLK